jgi:hypothetical protein
MKYVLEWRNHTNENPSILPGTIRHENSTKANSDISFMEGDGVFTSATTVSVCSGLWPGKTRFMTSSVWISFKKTEFGL